MKHGVYSLYDKLGQLRSKLFALLPDTSTSVVAEKVKDKMMTKMDMMMMMIMKQYLLHSVDRLIAADNIVCTSIHVSVFTGYNA